MTAPYTLPPHSARSPSGALYYTADKMHAAFAAGAASRDADWEDAINQRDAAEARAQYLQTEIEALRADAESWRKYKARKDAVIAADMGRNPLRAAIAAEGKTP